MGPEGWGGKWVAVVYVILTIVLLVITFLYQVHQRHVDVKCDLKAVHPNDFAIMVENLPLVGPMGCEEANIKRFFQKWALPGNKEQAEIVKVVIGWDIRQFRDYQERQRLLGKKYFALLRQGYDADNPQVRMVQNEFQKICNQLRSVSSAGNLISSGTAIVIFAQQQEHRKCLAKWSEPFFMQLHHFLDDWMGCGCGGFTSTWTRNPLYEGRVLKVTRSPNPSDVNWEDLGRTRWERLRRSEAIYFVSFLGHRTKNATKKKPDTTFESSTR